MTSTAQRSSISSSKKSVVSRSAPAEATDASEANLTRDGDNWFYSVNGRYVIGSAELSSAPVASRASIHPSTGFEVFSIALEDSAVVTVSCNQDCSEAGLQVSHMKLSGADSLETVFTDEEYVVTANGHSQTYSFDRVAHTNCNSEKAGLFETVSGELMTCSAVKSRADGTSLFAYLSVVPSNQF